MSKQEFINQTKQFLIEQYNYNENLLEVNSVIPSLEGEISVDILVKDKGGKPIGFILTDVKLRSRQEFLIELKEILTKSNITYGIYRYQKDDDIPGFIGLVREKSLFPGEISFKELEDYPRPNISWMEFILNLLFS